MNAGTIDQVVIIYNPHSTGNGKANATSLRDELGRRQPKLPVTLKQTEHAGHAEEIAREYASSDQRILLVSSSGDGGYHELINGILLSGARNVITGLLPSGNANDHFTAVSSGTAIDDIIAGSTRKIDVIKVTSTIDGQPWVRYAHAYAGIGLSPTVGRQLTKTKLNAVNEKWILLKNIFTYRHVTIVVGGNKRSYSSLVFSNIGQMSKVLQVAKDSSVTDGKFEVSAVNRQSKLRLFLYLFKAATIGLEENSSVSSFEFETTKKTLIQLDGEVYGLDAKCKVRVEAPQESLEIIV